MKIGTKQQKPFLAQIKQCTINGAWSQKPGEHLRKSIPESAELYLFVLLDFLNGDFLAVFGNRVPLMVQSRIELRARRVKIEL